MALLKNPNEEVAVNGDAMQEVSENTAAPGVQSEAEEQMSAQEEKQLTDAFNVATMIMHDDGPQGDEIAKLVLDNEDVAKGIGEATSAVLIATSNEIEVTEDIKMNLAITIFIELAELAVEAGAISEEEITEEFIDTSVSYAYSSYLQTQETMGDLDPEALQQSVDEATAEAEEMGVIPKGATAQPEQPQGLMSKAPQPGVN